jgi:hypothetical protein
VDEVRTEQYVLKKIREIVDKVVLFDYTHSEVENQPSIVVHGTENDLVRTVASIASWLLDYQEVMKGREENAM